MGRVFGVGERLSIQNIPSLIKISCVLHHFLRLSCDFIPFLLSVRRFKQKVRILVYSTYKMFITTIFVLYMFNVAKSAVLDPSLYLSPGPPLTDSTKDLSPSELWSRKVANIETHSTQNPTVEVQEGSSKEDSEDMDRAETFWPFVRSTEVKLGGVNIPLTFSVSGTYGKLSPPSGIISSSYIGVPGAGSIFGNYGKSGLAGTGYGRYGSPGVNVYGGNNQPTWSGWGNGKWGHYGKG